MSWQAYIDRMNQSRVGMSAICGKNGATYACSNNFNPTAAEVLTLLHAIETNDDSIFATGVTLGGKKFAVIRIDRDASILVLKGKADDNNKQNMIVGAACQTVVMGANTDDSTPGGTVRVAVEGLRDYLKSVSY